MLKSFTDDLFELFIQGTPAWHWSATESIITALPYVVRMQQWKVDISEKLKACENLGSARALLEESRKNLEPLSRGSDAQRSASWFWWTAEQRKIIGNLLELIDTEPKRWFNRFAFQEKPKGKGGHQGALPSGGAWRLSEDALAKALQKVEYIAKKFGLSHVSIGGGARIFEQLKILEESLMAACHHYQIEPQHFSLGAPLAVSIKGVYYLECLEKTQAFFHPIRERWYGVERIAQGMPSLQKTGEMVLSVDALNVKNHAQHEWLHYLDQRLFEKVFEALNKKLSRGLSHRGYRKAKGVFAQKGECAGVAFVEQMAPQYWKKVQLFAKRQQLEPMEALRLIHDPVFSKKTFLFEGHGVYSHLPEILRKELPSVNESFLCIWAELQNETGRELSVEKLKNEEKQCLKQLTEKVRQLLEPLVPLSATKKLEDWLRIFMSDHFYDIGRILEEKNIVPEDFLQWERSLEEEHCFCRLYKEREALRISKRQLSMHLAESLCVAQEDLRVYWKCFSPFEALPLNGKNAFIQKAKQIASLQANDYWLLPTEVLARSVTDNLSVVPEGMEVNLNMLNKVQQQKLLNYLKVWIAHVCR